MVTLERYDDNDFVLTRCGIIGRKLVNTEEYQTNREKLLSSMKELQSQFYTPEEERLFDEVLDCEHSLSCMKDEACYRQGFRDAICVIAGMRLD